MVWGDVISTCVIYLTCLTRRKMISWLTQLWCITALLSVPHMSMATSKLTIQLYTHRSQATCYRSHVIWIGGSGQKVITRSQWYPVWMPRKKRQSMKCHWLLCLGVGVLGLGEAFFCIGVLGVDILTLAFCPEIGFSSCHLSVMNKLRPEAVDLWSRHPYF